MLTILCVDNDLLILQIYRTLLEKVGYRVLTAADGPTAITLVRKQFIDVAVLDLKMQDMNGDDIAKVLLKVQPLLPIIVCTGHVGEIPEWLKWFAAGIVHKGDGPKSLLSTIEQCLHRPSPAHASTRKGVSALHSNIRRKAS